MSPCASFENLANLSSQRSGKDVNIVEEEVPAYAKMSCNSVYGMQGPDALEKAKLKVVSEHDFMQGGEQSKNYLAWNGDDIVQTDGRTVGLPSKPVMHEKEKGAESGSLGASPH